MSKYSDLLSKLDENNYKSLTISSDWAQGRAIFGGIVGAVMFKACQYRVNDIARKVRNVQITFVGPVLSDEEFNIETTVLREGGSTTSVECKLIQKGNVQSVMVGSFGKSRTSRHIVPPLVSPPEYAGPDNIEWLKPMVGKTPAFLDNHFNMAWAEGGQPFSHIPDISMGGWCQLKGESGHGDEGDLLTILDAWPPIALQMLKDFAPVSTLNWSIQFVQDMPRIDYGDWYKYRVEALTASDGYSNTQAHLWKDSDELLAISMQTITVFA